MIAVTERKSINDSLEEMMTPLEFAESMKFNNDASDLMQVIKRYPKFNGGISFKKNSDEDHTIS